MHANYSFALDFYDTPGAPRHGTILAESLDAVWRVLDALPEVMAGDCAASVLSGLPAGLKLGE